MRLSCLNSNEYLPRGGRARYRAVLCQSSHQSGYVLLGVLVLVAIFTIALAVAVPRIARSIQRDREMETIARGQQYTRAIRLFYKRFGKYPTTIDELTSSNREKFLRKRYIDPMTGKEDWRLIHLGEAKVPTLGFFGQPIGIAGGIGATNPLDSGTNSPGNLVNPTVPTGIAPQPDVSAGTAQNPVDPSTSAPTATSGATTSPLSTGGVVIGQIVGVGVPLDKSSLLNFRKQANYSRWEFVYDPTVDRTAAAGLAPATPSGLNPPPASAPAPGDPVLTQEPPPITTN